MTKLTLQQSKDPIVVHVSVIMLKEGKQYVSYCPALELSSYGNTPKAAKKAFEEAMEIFLEETSRKGTLKKYLLKLGWVLKQKPKPSYKPPTLSQRRSQQLLKKTSASVYDEIVTIPFA